MKKIHLSTLAIAVLASLTIASCKKDSTSSDAQVLFTMGSDNATANFVNVANPGGPTVLSTAPNATATGTASVVWTSAIANISQFKLQAKKDGIPFTITANGISNVDLLSVSPLSIAAAIPNGNYTNVEVHVVLAKSTGAAPPLVLKGTYTTKAGNQVPIEFDFNDNVEIIATAADIKVDGSSNVAANLALHLNKLLADVTTTDVDQTTRSTIGTATNGILITSSVNSTVYAKILADIAGAGGSSVTAVKK